LALLGNANYQSLNNLSYSLLLSRNSIIKEFKKKIVLPVVLYGCETWTLTLREGHRLNRVLRAIVDIRGRKGREAEKGSIMKSFISCMLHKMLLG
jgi:hypothetical protein